MGKNKLRDSLQKYKMQNACLRQRKTKPQVIKIKDIITKLEFGGLGCVRKFLDLHLSFEDLCAYVTLIETEGFLCPRGIDFWREGDIQHITVFHSCESLQWTRNLLQSALKYTRTENVLSFSDGRGFTEACLYVGQKVPIIRFAADSIQFAQNEDQRCRTIPFLPCQMETCTSFVCEVLFREFGESVLAPTSDDKWWKATTTAAVIVLSGPSMLLPRLMSCNARLMRERGFRRRIFETRAIWSHHSIFDAAMPSVCTIVYWAPETRKHIYEEEEEEEGKDKKTSFPPKDGILLDPSNIFRMHYTRHTGITTKRLDLGEELQPLPGWWRQFTQRAPLSLIMKHLHVPKCKFDMQFIRIFTEWDFSRNQKRRPREVQCIDYLPDCLNNNEMAVSGNNDDDCNYYSGYKEEEEEEEEEEDGYLTDNLMNDDDDDEDEDDEDEEVQRQQKRPKFALTHEEKEQNLSLATHKQQRHVKAIALFMLLFVQTYWTSLPIDEQPMSDVCQREIANNMTSCMSARKFEEHLQKMGFYLSLSNNKVDPKKTRYVKTMYLQWKNQEWIKACSDDLSFLLQTIKSLSPYNLRLFYTTGVRRVIFTSRLDFKIIQKAKRSLRPLKRIFSAQRLSELLDEFDFEELVYKHEQDILNNYYDAVFEQHGW